MSDEQLQVITGIPGPAGSPGVPGPPGTPPGRDHRQDRQRRRHRRPDRRRTPWARELADSAVTSAKIADGTITSTDVAASTFAAFSKVGNLLTANQASVETDTTGWESDGATSVARSTAQAYHGSASLLITSPAADYGVRSLTGVYGIPVVEGETYTVTAACKSASRRQKLGIFWYTAAGSYIQYDFTATAAAPTSWTVLSLSMVAPATAAYVSVTMRPAESGSEGDTAYWDSVGFWKGAGGKWAMPGTPITGLSEVATNGAVHLSGTGAPEGVVTAAPGSHVAANRLHHRREGLDQVG